MIEYEPIVIPNDPNPPFKPSGLRLGTPAITTRGLNKSHMEKLAEWIVGAVQNRNQPAKMARLKEDIKHFAIDFPLPSSLDADE